jgi:lipopolysaccharide export system protein LptA
VGSTLDAMDGIRQVTVAQSVTVAGENGKPAYELKATNGQVEIRQKPISLKAPKVTVFALREALYALGRD